MASFYNYTREDIARVRRQLAEAIPDAEFVAIDYGFGLAMNHAGHHYVLFQSGEKPGTVVASADDDDVQTIIRLAGERRQ